MIIIYLICLLEIIFFYKLEDLEVKNLLFIIFIILLISCTSNQLATNNKLENGKVSINLDKQNPSEEVKEVLATLSREEYPDIIRSLILADSSAAVILIENMDVGVWHVLIEAFNNEKEVIYKGETDINIEPNIITPVHIQLIPVSGGVFLAVSWDSANPFSQYLLAHFPFDNNLNDISNYHNDANFYSGSFIDGIIGSALQFNGEDSFVNIPHQDHYNTDEKTIMFWFYKSNNFIDDTPGLVDAEGLLFKSWDTGLDRDFSISISNSQPPFDVYLKVGNGTSSLLEARGTDKIIPKQWYHIACMIDNESLKLFLNGQLIAKTPFEGEFIHYNSPIIVGKASVDSYSTRYFNGKIDDLRIYNKTLKESDIISIFSSR